MDGPRFDDLVRSLAREETCRRHALKIVAGAAAGGVLSLLGIRGTIAVPVRPAAVPGNAHAACPADQVRRRGVGCVCKATGRPPDASGYCPCPSGRTRCGDACVDLM